MKKIIFISIVVVAIAAVAAFNVNLNSPGDKLSGLALANVEALASGEGGLPPVVVPCSSEENKTCIFFITDNDGRCYAASMSNFKNV